MPLSDADRARLDRPTVSNVQLKLAVTEQGNDQIVPGLGLKRKDVEDWLAEQTVAAAKLQFDTLWWARLATWIAGFAVLLAIALAFLKAAARAKAIVTEGHRFMVAS